MDPYRVSQNSLAPAGNILRSRVDVRLLVR